MLADTFNKEKLTDLIQANLINNSDKGKMRDNAFAYYYFIKIGRLDIVKKYIKSTANEIGISINSCLDLAFWLWVVGEYLNVTKDFEELDVSIRTINYCIECIKTNWDKDCSHWLENSISGVFTTNIAILYGAVNGINNFLNNSELEQLLSTMRYFLFLVNIREGEYVGKKACIGVMGDMGDISVIAVPFGFAKLDDLFHNRSISSVEERLMTEGVRFSKHNYFCEDGARTDLTCLLSWYYSETGYIEYSDCLLKKAKDMLLKTTEYKEKNERLEKVKNLSYILYAIAAYNLSVKKKSKDKNFFKIVNIIHKPAGEHDPYTSRDYERYPRYPEVNDSVYLKINTQPFNLHQKVYAKYRVNGKVQPKLLMNIETTSSGKKYWQVCIGKFNFDDKVDYTFEVHFGGTKVVSTQYSFIVRKWYTLKEIKYVDYTSHGVKLLFKPVGKIKKIPCLCIEKYGEDSLKFSFSMEQREELYYYIKMTEKANISRFSLRLGKVKFEFDGYNIKFVILGNRGEHILQSYHGKNSRLLDLLIGRNDKIHKIRFNFLMQRDEKIFGMGERFSHIEFRGLEVDSCVYNKYKDHGLKTYLPVPFLISSKGYGIFFDISTFLKCRFGSKIPDLNEVEINLESKKQSMDFYVFTGKPKRIVQEYTDLTGKPVLPPKWCFGLWISSNSWDCQKDIYEQIDNARKHEIPTSAIILEQWSDEATFYIFNGGKYDVKPGEYYFKYEDLKFPKDGKWPNPKKMVDFLHKLGIRVLLWQSPYHTYLGSAENKQRDADEKTMLENGYHVKYKDGKEYRSHFYWFGHCLLPDFTNPETRKWWMNKRKYLIKDIGIDGFKTDGGECILDEGLVFHNGKTEEEMRNEYANEFAGAYFNFARQHVNGGGVAFSRVGYKGAQKFPIHWAGDDVSTFNAFRDSVNAGLSSGISGISFWGWDFGGFSGDIPTAELYLRAVQMSVFCPIMQYHSESMEKEKYDRTPWNIAERTNTPYVIDIFKKYVDLRMNILPYIYQQAVVSSETGIPMMRAMFLEYPDDTNCITMTRQYMFGDDMLIAPVMEEGAYIKDIYLPEGKWMDFFTGEVVNGGKFIKVDTDISHIPVFLTEDSIIPLNLSNECKLFSHVGNDMECYRNLCFLLYITGYVQYEFNDDLGNKVNIDASIQWDTISVSLESNYIDSITLILKNTSGVKDVKVEGVEIPQANTIDALNDETYINLPESLIIRLCCYNKSTHVKICLAE